MNKQRLFKLSFPLIILMLLIFMSCEGIFESIDDGFKKEETTMGHADQMAKESLSSYSLTVNSSINTDTNLVAFYDALAEIEVNDDFYTYDTSVSASDSNVLIIDTLLTSYQVVSPTDTNISYLRLNNNKSGNLVCFITDYVDIKMYAEESGQMVETDLIDNNIPLETITGYYTVLADGTPKPVIKSRYVFSVEAQDYLIEIITGDQTVNKTFKTAFHFE